MTEDRKALDLDELFGQARAVKVRWQGIDYELLRMEGISPKQATQFNALHLKTAQLQKSMQASETDVSDDDAQKVDETFNAMLHILCPDLPVKAMPFMAKMRTIMFYMEETQGKNAVETALKTIGATPSAE